MPVDIDIARRIVGDYHYAGGAANTATYLHGLFMKGQFMHEQCQGVAWWIPPTRTAAEATYPQDWMGVLSLSRLVICPGVPKNACSFLLARSRRLIDPERFPCLVTYADEWQNHSGAIYSADNWQYCGKTKPERTYMLNGKMISRKAGGRTRTHQEMLDMGARCVGKYSRHKYIFVR